MLDGSYLFCAIETLAPARHLPATRRRTVSGTTVGILRTPGSRGVTSHSDRFGEPVGEDIASPDEYETGSGTRAPSAKSGPVLWPKKPKTQKTNAVMRENLSRSFDSFTACLLCWIVSRQGREPAWQSHAASRLHNKVNTLALCGSKNRPLHMTKKQYFSELRRSA